MNYNSQARPLDRLVSSINVRCIVNSFHVMMKTMKKQLSGIVLDMDGTLCEPQSWMFSMVRCTQNLHSTHESCAWNPEGG